MKQALRYVLLGIGIGLLFSFLVFPLAKEEVVTQSLISLLRNRPLFLPFHALSSESIREFLASSVPELRREITDRMINRLMRVIRDLYAEQIKAYTDPPQTDRELVLFLERTGLLEELGLDMASAERLLGEIVSEDGVLKAPPESAQVSIHHPPQGNIRLPAEFERIGAVIVSWPIGYLQRWGHHAKLVSLISQEAEAHILVPAIEWKKAVQLYLMNYHFAETVIMSRIKFLIVKSDDVWTRDYGPTGVLVNEVPVFIINPYKPAGFPYFKYNNTASYDVARTYGIPAYQLPLVIEGGNIISDGKGTMIMFDSVLRTNPDVSKEHLESLLADYFGLKRLILLPCLEGELTGHIDMAVKFIDEETLMVASTTRNHRWYRAFEEIAQQLSAYKSFQGNLYRIIRVPLAHGRVVKEVTNLPSELHGICIDTMINRAGYTGRWWNNPWARDEKQTFWSYINSLTLNNMLIVPLFGVESDMKAIEIYRQSFPGKRVTGICFSDFPVGSAHCQTKEIPVSFLMAEE